MQPSPSRVASALAWLVGGDTVDFWLRHADPLAALDRVWARVEALHDETARARTVVLRPNGNWRGFRAGQHVLVTVAIGGRRFTRAYSLTGAEGAATVSITVGRHPQGRVSGFVHETLSPGDVVELSQAAGTFVLPDDPRVPLLLIAGGTGITPFLSMLRTLRARDEHRDVVLLLYARGRDEVIARDELAALPGVRTHVVLTRPAAGAADALRGRFTPAQLVAVVPDFETRDAYVCGPRALMDAVAAHWVASGVAHRLRRESFGEAGQAAGDLAGTAATITCTRSGRVVTVSGARPLLHELEAAGLRPRHGCRAGICHQCTCVKTSGAVEDVRTGAVSTEDEEPVQLCISRARGDLVLAL